VEKYKEEFITFMVRSNVLTFGDFTTKSGRKTPFFINTGNYKTGEQIQRLGDFYAQAIMANMGKKFDVIYGPAYKGIPLAVSAVIAMNSRYGFSVPYCFNRKEAKDHGEGGMLIGHTVKPGDRILIIDDVTTAGTSVRQSVELLSAVAPAVFSGLSVSVTEWKKEPDPEVPSPKYETHST
jgi:orotate phosphoribosyltransferase